ncbi:MAG: hypothetical protein AAFV98_02985 [Chloroflexota bacterium]
MNFVRRVLYLPLLLVVAASLLIIFGVINLDINIPVSWEIVAAIAGGLLVTMFLVDMRIATRSWEHPEPEDPPRSDKVIYPTPIEDAVESIEEAEDFVAHANGRVKIAIDIEEDLEDMPEDDA